MRKTKKDGKKAKQTPDKKEPIRLLQRQPNPPRRAVSSGRKDKH